MDDLLEAVVAQLEITEEGITIREICIAQGLPATVTNMSRIGKQVSDLVALGKAAYVGKKWMTCIDGSPRRTPAYKLVKEEG